MRCSASPTRLLAGPPHVLEQMYQATRCTLDEQVPPMAGLLLAKGGHHQMPMQGGAHQEHPSGSAKDHQANNT
jgi:hypothetical protein